MDWRREDRIYELQQELALIPPEDWAAHLNACCAADAELRLEVMKRQGQVDQQALNRGPAFRVLGLPSKRQTR